MSRELTRSQQIERSIITRFSKELWSPFVGAIKRYKLISSNDKIAVCISGGKDSMLMAKLFQELHKHTEIPFSLVFLVMDPGYNEENRRKVHENAEIMDIPIVEFSSNIFDVSKGSVRGGGRTSPCYLCARMRRGNLYSKAREMGCNKIALGHHFNDVVETTVMGMFYGAQLQAMPPKLHSKNFPGMELIRPMYLIHEDDIISFARYNKLEFIQCACSVTEEIAQSGGCGSSKRQEIKLLLRQLKKTAPDIEKSIFNSIHDVCLDTMVGWKYKGQEHSFLDEYDQ